MRGSASLRGHSRRFHPGMVPEVAAGYYWLASSATGHGTTGFRVPEGNGKASFDLLQATVANQPTILTEAGGTQFRMRGTNDGAPTSLPLNPATQVAAGWTGPTTVCGWWRVPFNGGVIVGPSSGIQPFAHNLASGTSRRIALTGVAGTPARLAVSSSSDGSNQSGNTAFCTSPFTGVGWVWLTVVWDLALKLGGSSPGDVTKIFAGHVQQALTTTPTTAAASLHNPTTSMAVSTFVAAANLDTFDWAACYYCNGILSASSLIRLSNYYNPSGVPFALA